MIIAVRFSARALVGANAGLDPDASSERYRAALVEAIRADFGEARIDVERDDAAPLLVRVQGVDDPRRAAVERSVTDLAWVVKQCASWSVPSI